MIGPVCTDNSICLHIGFWYGSFAWKWCVFNLSAFYWKTVLQLFENFRFAKLKYWKRSNISTDCHIKTCRSLRSDGGLFWKSLVAFFRRTYALSVGFKMKHLRKSAFQCYKTKTSSSFAVKPVKRYFYCLLHESPFSNICTL